MKKESSTYDTSKDALRTHDFNIRGRKDFWNRFSRENVILFATLVLVVIFSLTAPHFFTFLNIRNIFQQTAAIGIVTIGQAFLLLTGQFDLSLGQNVMMTSCLSAWLIKFGGVNPWFAVLLGIIAGVLVGACNGYLVAYRRTPAFIATLGMQLICMGLGRIITNDSPISGMPSELAIFGTASIGGVKYGVPSSILIMLFLYIVATFISRRTKLGRNFYAMGGGEEAAYFSGIDVKKFRLYAFALAGGLAALGGTVLLSRIDSASVTNGNAYELDTVIASVIGGISIMGGRGKIPQALCGAIFLTVFFNGMTMLNVHPFIQNILKGVVLVFAVGIDSIRNKR